jgi:hypothetical protein
MFRQPAIVPTDENGNFRRIDKIAASISSTSGRSPECCVWISAFRSNLDVGRVSAYRIVAALAHCPHNRLGHRVESGRPSISDPASELSRVKPRRRDEKRVFDTVWSTGIPGPGTMGIFDRLCQFPVLATVRKTDKISHSKVRDIH